MLALRYLRSLITISLPWSRMGALSGQVLDYFPEVFKSSNATQDNLLLPKYQLKPGRGNPDNPPIDGANMFEFGECIALSIYVKRVPIEVEDLPPTKRTTYYWLLFSHMFFPPHFNQ